VAVRVRQEQACACGCGAVVVTPRKFVNLEHYSAWAIAGALLRAQPCTLPANQCRETCRASRAERTRPLLPRSGRCPATARLARDMPADVPPNWSPVNVSPAGMAGPSSTCVPIRPP